MIKIKQRHQPETVAPIPTHVHHHTPGQVGPLLTKYLLIPALGLIGLWLIGLFLLHQLGYPRPGEALATVVLWLAAIGLFLLTGQWLSTSIIDRIYDHRQAIEKERTEQMRHRQLMGRSAITETRTLGDRQRLSALVYDCMLDAYDHQAQHGGFNGSERPWSRRQAGARTLIWLGETEPVGETLGAKVRAFLHQAEVITAADQLNLARYPDIASVQRLLYQPLRLATGPEQSEPGEGASNWSIVE